MGEVNIALVVALVVVVVAAAVAVVWQGVAQRRVGGDRGMSQPLLQQAVAAAVAQANERASRERDLAVQAAVEQIVTMAGEQFGLQLAVADKSLAGRQDLITERLGQVQVGVAQQVQQLTAAVQQLNEAATRQFGEVGQSLQQQAEATSTLQQVTGTLREALAHSNVRGQWGERMADDVLRLAGMQPNVNYVKRTAVHGDGRGIPDFTFLLPDGHVMFMDVKFPIDAYMQYLQAASEVERATHLDSFLRAIRGHVNELRRRDYSTVDTRPAVDNVLMFVPNEAVLAFIHEHAPTLIDDALGQHVVLCSPLSLFTFLGVVRQAFDNFRLEQTSREIIDVLARFAAEWRKYTESVEKVRRQLTTVTTSFDDLAGPRLRKLDQQLRTVDQLRAQQHVAVEGPLAALAEPEPIEPGPDETTPVSRDTPDA